MLILVSKEHHVLLAKLRGREDPLPSIQPAYAMSPWRAIDVFAWSTEIHVGIQGIGLQLVLTGHAHRYIANKLKGRHTLYAQ